MHYPARITHQTAQGNYAVRFPDVPEAFAIGDTKEEAARNAQDALESAIDFYFDEGQSVPLPSTPAKMHTLILLPASVAAKVLLHNEMVRQGIHASELARRMNIPRQHVTRLIDPRHTTKIDTIDDALRALGKELVVTAV